MPIWQRLSPTPIEERKSSIFLSEKSARERETDGVHALSLSWETAEEGNNNNEHERLDFAQISGNYSIA